MQKASDQFYYFSQHVSAQLTIFLVVNFAAALVIQGSACVYSKKVEYLHSLVYQALEYVAENKVKAVRSKARAEVGQDDDDEYDDEEQFLSTGDALEGNIN